MKILSQFLFIVFLSSCWAGAPSSIDDVDSRNYSELLSRCNGNACCKSSAQSLEKAKGYVLKKGEPFECPTGFQPNGLKCVDSYRWCEPKTTN